MYYTEHMRLDLSSIDGTDESEIHALFLLLDQAIKNRQRPETLEHIRTITETLRTLTTEMQKKLWPILTKKVESAKRAMSDTETDTRIV